MIDLDVDAVEVEAGETIDFVVDFREGLNSDQFLWSPRLRQPGMASDWDATRDFAGPVVPRLTPMEQLAQVLLMGNELMFVD
jgi:hypothetical protein